MPPKDKKLASLRSRIDAIDNQMVALLKSRADIVHEVGRVKGNLPVYIRPGRDAIMLRVLLKKPRGKVPAALIHRLWREMIGAFTLQEGKLKVAVGMPEGEEGFWDLARDHFGSFTPMEASASPEAAFKALTTGKAKVAALPYPRETGAAWWRELLNKPKLKIFYRFPFDATPGNARKHVGDGLVVGDLAPEKTGADISVVVVEWKKTASASAIQKAAKALPGKKSAHILSAEKGAPLLSWMEIGGFIAPDAAGLKNWHRQHKDIILKYRMIGAYPAQVSG
jgi:chorismate mutase / prephenate dehydratase